MKSAPELLLSGHNDTLIWGMDNAERMRRLFGKLDLSGSNSGAGILWINLDYVFDPQWMHHVLAQPDMLVTSNGVPVFAYMMDSAAIDMLAAGKSEALKAQRIELSDKPKIYNHELRKLETPFVEKLTPASARAVERKDYYGAYKGVTDILTKYLWPELALVLTRFAARTGIPPNMVTAMGGALCVLATWLFYIGQFWPGIAAGFVFMVFDTVDGKLARCTMTTSGWGEFFDHGIDLVHPPFWWIAWAIGLGSVGLPLSDGQFRFVMIAVLGGYVLQRVIEGIFLVAFKQHIHVWRKIDSQFRLITARRNPNMILLVVALVLGRPDIGLIAVAWWTIISLLVHMVQMMQAFFVKWRGGTIISWLKQGT